MFLQKHMYTYTHEHTYTHGRTHARTHAPPPPHTYCYYYYYYYYYYYCCCCCCCCCCYYNLSIHSRTATLTHKNRQSAKLQITRTPTRALSQPFHPICLAAAMLKGPRTDPCQIAAGSYSDRGQLGHHHQEPLATVNGLKSPEER